jgi:hypothetical protein
MSTDEQATAAAAEDAAPAEPSWWHRDHPTFASLAGFYTGLIFAIVVPGLYVAIFAALFGQSRAESLFPFVLVTLVVPLLLVISPRTRRFGSYMWLGIVSTLVVVLGVGAAVFWYMMH